VLLQYDYVVQMVTEYRRKLQLTSKLLRELHYLAIHDIYICAGRFRNGPVRIWDGRHTPPPHYEVPALVAEMCDYVNAHPERPPVHLAAYLMWRHNWIHPFFGGNGRTSRAVSYMMLCARLGYVLPGEKTIPEQIEGNRQPYIEALRAADEAWAKGVLDVSRMEELLSNTLAAQLYFLHQRAVGQPPTGH
jgi:Fic family protein